MNVNRVINQAYYENNKGNKAGSKNNGNGFYESLSENINSRNEESQKNVASSKSTVPAKPYSYRNVISADYYESEMVNVSSIAVCEVRQLTYQDSDYTKAYAEHGFTLIAKVNVDNRSVYIERKKEDGTVSGYEVDIDKIDGKTDNIYEKTALEAWGKMELEKKVANTLNESYETDLTHEEALLQFYEYIEDIIKNGPPKYMIGNSEFSIDEWDKFMTDIDEQLEDIRNEVKERIEQLKAQQIAEEAAKENESVPVPVLVPVSAKEADSQEKDKMHINADEVAGLSGEQLKEQALTRLLDQIAKVPYGYLAKDGIIDYKGVIFVCDEKHNAIHLGDTSDMKKCIRIPLSKGGCLIVNRENLGDLATAIGMFSPEDVNRILRAIAEDAKIQQMKQQIDEDESGIELAEEVSEEEAEIEPAVEVSGQEQESAEEDK